MLPLLHCTANPAMRTYAPPATRPRIAVRYWKTMSVKQYLRLPTPPAATAALATTQPVFPFPRLWSRTNASCIMKSRTCSVCTLNAKPSFVYVSRLLAYMYCFTCYVCLICFIWFVGWLVGWLIVYYTVGALSIVWGTQQPQSGVVVECHSELASGVEHIDEQVARHHWSLCTN